MPAGSGSGIDIGRALNRCQRSRIIQAEHLPISKGFLKSLGPRPATILERIDRSACRAHQLRRHEFRQQRHPDKDTITRLPEVRGAGIGIHFRCDLVDAGKGMQDDRLRSKMAQVTLIDDVDAVGLVVLFLGGESLSLDARLVNDVGLGHCPFEVRLVTVANSRRIQRLADVLPHRNGIGRDEEQLGVAREPEHQGQRTHRPAESKIANKGDLEVVEHSQFGSDRVEVEERLGRVLPGPSPPLMMGTVDTAAARAAAPCSWCRITIPSA